MNPSINQLRPLARRRKLRAAAASTVLASAAALAGVLPGAGVAAAELSLPKPVVPTPTVPVVTAPTVPVVTVPSVPSAPTVPYILPVEVPSLQTLEQLLKSSEPSSGGPSGGSGSGSRGAHAGAGTGSGYVLSSSTTSVGAFQVLSVNVTKSGRILETIALPAPGALVVRATESRPARRASGTARRRHARVAQLARFTAHVTRGIATVVLNPKLSRSKSKLVIATTYTPFGGAATTITRSVVVRRASSSRRKHR